MALKYDVLINNKNIKMMNWDYHLKIMILKKNQEIELILTFLI